MTTLHKIFEVGSAVIEVDHFGFGGESGDGEIFLEIRCPDMDPVIIILTRKQARKVGKALVKAAK